MLLDEVHAIRALGNDVGVLELTYNPQDRQLRAGLRALTFLGELWQRGCLVARWRDEERGCGSTWGKGRYPRAGQRCGTNQGISDCLLHRNENMALTAKPDLTLGGMNINVYLLRRQGDIDRHYWVFARHQHSLISLFNSIGQHTALHPAAIDEEAEVVAIGA